MKKGHPEGQRDGHRIVVRGSGCVALAAALALGRRGWRVAVAAGAGFAREVAREDVRTYALNAASVALLGSLKVWDALPVEARTAVQDMRIEGDTGAVLSFSSWSQGADALAWIVDARALEQALRDAVRFAPHVELVPADAPDGSLTVLAEGRQSEARERLGVVMDLHPYRQRGVAARLVSDEPHDGVARQWFRSPDVLALLPFDSPAPGHSHGLVWSLPDARADELLAMPADAFETELAAATGTAAGTLRLASERASWPLVLGRAREVVGPGWVLLGDAAHLVHPLAGQGLNLGLADVAALDEVLAGREPWRSPGDERLLRRYARRRAGPTQAMATMTDSLLHLFASEQPLVRELRNHGLTLVNNLPPLKRLLASRAADL